MINGALQYKKSWINFASSNLCRWYNIWIYW